MCCDLCSPVLSKSDSCGQTLNTGTFDVHRKEKVIENILLLSGTIVVSSRFYSFWGMILNISNLECHAFLIPIW